MPYEIHAAIASDSVIDQAADGWSRARIVRLPQGFSLIPLVERDSDEGGDFPTELDALCQTSRDYTGEVPYWYTDGIARWLREASQWGKIVYVEIECTGGWCDRAAVGWEAGEIGYPSL